MIYRAGDRVRLKNSGGYPCYSGGMTGTVLAVHDQCVRVRVDNCTKHREGLNFYFREVEPLEPVEIRLEFVDKYGDKLEVMRNSRNTDDLYFRNSKEAVGVVMTRNQALELANAIKHFYNAV